MLKVLSKINPFTFQYKGDFFFEIDDDLLLLFQKINLTEKIALIKIKINPSKKLKLKILKKLRQPPPL